MVKDTMKRKKPSFNETYHGYRTFSALLEDAQKQGLLDLETDKRSGTYVVTRFGDELKTRPVAEETREPRKRRGNSRRRGGTKRTSRTGAADGIAVKDSAEPPPLEVREEPASPAEPPRPPPPEPPPPVPKEPERRSFGYGIPLESPSTSSDS
jgi:hypothetical protein